LSKISTKKFNETQSQSTKIFNRDNKIDTFIWQIIGIVRVDVIQVLKLLISDIYDGLL